MPESQPISVRGRDFEPPGPGGWDLESTHTTRPFTPFNQAAFKDGFVRGFKEGTARYGLMLSHLKPAFVHSFGYMQPVPVGAPEGALKLPPKAVLQLVSRLHPEMRRRTRTAERAMTQKLWRQDLAHWDEVDKPEAIERHQAIQAVDVAALTDAELADHVQVCAQHFIDSVYLHHKYTIPSTLPVGDFVAAAQAWTGAPPGELLSLLRGGSAISRGAAADELELAGKALAASDDAREILGGPAPATQLLDTLAARADVGPQVRDYLEAVRWRCVGYDVGDKAAGEIPNALVEALRATLAGATVRPDDGAALERIRSKVPAEHLEDFDDRLAEVRLMYRLRDERGVFGDGWAAGLARRALLEAGHRLTAHGLLNNHEHAVDLTADEASALLLRAGDGPLADEVAERFDWRSSVTTTDAPEFLRATPPPPPPVEWLPKGARRAAAAMNTAMFGLFGVPETPNTDTLLTGLSVNGGIYEGTARLVLTSADFDRIKQGDVLIAKTTSPFFNVVLPMLGALVTDRGGQLCHAAIVAREYGIPGIVGTREATTRIPDGARVRVDGATGEVRLLE
jgi:rifampicin phosphotransferase